MADLTADDQPIGDEAAEQLWVRRKRAGENIEQAAQHMKARYDKRRKVATKYIIGDLVLWRQAPSYMGDKGINKKLRNQYDGSYKVSKVLGNDRYRITSLKGIRGYKKFRAVAAADSLRRYCSTTSGDKLDNTGDDSSGEVVDRQDLIDLLES